MDSQISITKEQAERLLAISRNHPLGFDVMCREYGHEYGTSEWINDDGEIESDELLWAGMGEADLDENGHLDDAYQTFEIWI